MWISRDLVGTVVPVGGPFYVFRARSCIGPIARARDEPRENKASVILCGGQLVGRCQHKTKPLVYHGNSQHSPFRIFTAPLRYVQDSYPVILLLSSFVYLLWTCVMDLFGYFRKNIWVSIFDMDKMICKLFQELSTKRSRHYLQNDLQNDIEIIWAWSRNDL